MARFPYPDYKDKAFTAAGKPTINVLKLLSYSSATVDLWASIGNAQFTQLELSKKNRELVILLCAAKFGSAYEWTHHAPMSARLGVTDKQREVIQRAGKAKAFFSSYDWAKESVGFSEGERVLLRFLEAVIDTGEVDEAVWVEATRAFSKREIVEIISVQGFYYTFARVTTVLKIDIDGAVKPREQKL